MGDCIEKSVHAGQHTPRGEVIFLCKIRGSQSLVILRGNATERSPSFSMASSSKGAAGRVLDSRRTLQRAQRFGVCRQKTSKRSGSQ